MKTKAELAADVIDAERDLLKRRPGALMRALRRLNTTLVAYDAAPKDEPLHIVEAVFADRRDAEFAFARIESLVVGMGQCGTVSLRTEGAGDD